MDQGLVGFANIADQVHRKSVKRGFDFTLMVVGESGLGKSTLVDSLFLADLYSDRKIPSVEKRMGKTAEIQKTTMEIEEKGVKLRLTVVDTPGFGDNLDGDESWKACVKYVEDQFETYFESESGLNRKNIIDTRVHCCLYFIPPYGHGLRQIDLEFLKRLQYKVNLVPIIAKSDCLTVKEIGQLKDQIIKEINEHDIEIYQFPECDSDEDDEFKAEDEKLKSAVPFAVVGGTHTLEINGRKARGRQYPWGFVEVDNPKHSDFSTLRRFLIQTHMQDLKDVTHDVHYENFRVHCLAELSKLQEQLNLSASDATNRTLPSSIKAESSLLTNPSFSSTYNGSSSARLKYKKITETYKSQEELDQETEKLLQEKDDEIQKMHQMLQQMQAKLNQRAN